MNEHDECCHNDARYQYAMPDAICIQAERAALSVTVDKKRKEFQTLWLLYSLRTVV